MKQLLIAASVFVFAAGPAHAQLLGGGGGLGGSINSTVNSTVRGSSETLRSTSRGTLRGNAETRGDQQVDRRSGEVSVARSLDAGSESATGQLIESPLGSLGGHANASGDASSSGSANAELIGTDAIQGAAQNGVGRTRDGVGQVRNLATPAVGALRGRASGVATQTNDLSGAASGTATGSGGVGDRMLAVAGSGAAEGEGAFAITPGMPIAQSSGEQFGMVRDVIATRSGQVREITVQTRDGLINIPASDLAVNGSALVAGDVAGTSSTGREENVDAAE